MEIINKKVEELIPYENNPRDNDEAVPYVANSIKEFGFKVPIVIDKDNVIIAGHTRLKAAKQLGLEEVPVIIADDLTDEQIKAFRLADNKVSEQAKWDFDLLNIELDDLELDMEQFGFLNIEEFDNPYSDNPNEKNLQERFLAPPFSIIDTRQKYWQDRKREWKEFGIKSDEGRAENLLGGGLLKLAQKTGSDKTLTGTSIFDPALCETMYKWFNIDGGKIFDPFAGGSVRGIVATKLGYDYTGIDLSTKQIEANKYKVCSGTIIYKDEKQYSAGETVNLKKINTRWFDTWDYDNNTSLCTEQSSNVIVCSSSSIEENSEWNYWTYGSYYINKYGYTYLDNDKDTMNFSSYDYDDWIDFKQFGIIAPTTFTMPEHSALFVTNQTK